MFGSTLQIGNSNQFSRFIGAHVPVGAPPNTMLDIEFLGAGILDLQVSADYDLASGVVRTIRDGAFGTSALYSAGSADMLLVSGSISAVDEPETMAVLGIGVALAVGASRRRPPIATGSAISRG